MELETARCVLSPLGVDDIDAFVDYRRHPSVAHYQSSTTDYSRADAEQLVAEQPRTGLPAAGEWLQLAVRRRADGTLLGDVAVGADPVQPQTFELGVTLMPSVQGNGYAQEALAAVRDQLFASGAHRITMQGDARNAAVLRLVSRLGFRHEASLHDADWFTGEWSSLECFAQLRSEWVP